MAESSSAARPAGEQRANDAFPARTLLRSARSATLATVQNGQPFATLVTPAAAADLSVLLLLSELSEHTRHLRADPRCSLLVCGPAETVNPQTAPRLTITGVAEIEPDRALKARWLAMHPYAGLYADFADFSLWRIHPRGGLFVGGFARATRLRTVDLVPEAEAMRRLAEAAPAIIEHCNAHHAITLDAIVGEGTGWRMVGVDVDGMDLAHGETVRHLPWRAPLSHPEQVREELIRLAGG